jgi:tripartite-type tricarboxylate transporter receptor subunit TctC
MTKNTCLAAGVTLAFALAAGPAAAWEPTKPVEIVVAAEPPTKWRV